MLSSGRRDLVVGLGFLAVSFAEFGWPALPHPSSTILGSTGDPNIFVWSLAWWPHALLHGLDPLVTHALYAPQGANLAWVTAVPTLALVLAPVTLLFGAIASFDLASFALPALSAFCAYRLCLALSGSLWGSLVGGYLYGFSAFVLSQQLQGHLNLTAAFVPPLLGLALARRLRGEWSARRFVLVVGVLLALQLGISTEVALTATLMLVLALLLAALLVAEARGRLRRLVPELAGGYAVGALLASPLLVEALLHFPGHAFTGGEDTVTDAGNLLVPTQVVAVGGSSFPSFQYWFNLHESALYLGPPALVIVALYAWRGRRSAWARALVAFLALAILLTLGSALQAKGHRVVSLPWRALERLPAFDNVHPPRLAEYVSLAAALAVSLWTAGARGRVYRRPYALPLLAVAALVPPVWQKLAVSPNISPSFFTTSLVRTCIPAGETVATFPFGALSDTWQVESGFRFRVAGGYLQSPVFGQQPLIGFYDDPTVVVLDFYGDRGLPTVNSLLAFASRHGVGRFVEVLGSEYPSMRQLERIGTVSVLGGVAVVPGCGSPPLTARPLGAGTKLVLHEQAEGMVVGWCHYGNGGNYYPLPAGVQPSALLTGATHAIFVDGHGLACIPPRGYRRHGFAPTSLGVPPRFYPYFVR